MAPNDPLAATTGCNVYCTGTRHAVIVTSDCSMDDAGFQGFAEGLQTRLIRWSPAPEVDLAALEQRITSTYSTITRTFFPYDPQLPPDRAWLVLMDTGRLAHGLPDKGRTGTPQTAKRWWKFW